MSIRDSSESEHCTDTSQSQIRRALIYLEFCYHAELSRLILKTNSKTNTLRQELRKITEDAESEITELSQRFFASKTSLESSLKTSSYDLTLFNSSLAINRNTITDEQIRNFLKNPILPPEKPKHSECSATVPKPGLIWILKDDSRVIEYSCSGFGYGTRSLCLPGDTLLITGGYSSSNLACELSVSTGAIRSLPHLNTRRLVHAAAFIGNKPAVIGGATPDQDDSLDSVELFDGDIWVEIAKLNYKRGFCSAAATQGATYVFGGAMNGLNPIDSIEKYSNSKWDVLDIKLVVPAMHIGIHCAAGRIVLLGGLGPNLCRLSRVYEWSEDAVKLLEALQKPAYFPDNMWIDKRGYIISYGANASFDSIIVKYKLY